MFSMFRVIHIFILFSTYQLISNYSLVSTKHDSADVEKLSQALPGIGYPPKEIWVDEHYEYNDEPSDDKNEKHSLSDDGTIFPSRDTDAIKLPIISTSHELNEQDDPEIEIHVAISMNITEMGEKLKAERTVAFALITVFSVLCASMAIISFLIFIVYYKRNIASFARGRVFSREDLYRRRRSSNRDRLLPITD